MRRVPHARILVIDDQPRTAELLAARAPELDLLEVRGRPPRLHAVSWREAEPLLSRAARGPDAVVLDLCFDRPDVELLPDGAPLGDGPGAARLRRERQERQGLYILERLRRLWPDLPVVLTTAHEEIPFEEEALRLSADAFTYTVGEDEATGEGILRLLRRVLAERDAAPVTGRFYWGRSAAMRTLRRKLLPLAPTPLPLLLTGPTGTGKNLLVREVVHPASGRRGALVSFDCATVPESLLPAALFGAVRGAYTGAETDRPGVFEAAAAGTLFLDEVENLGADAQKQLLTALNDGTVRRLGAVAETPHTARVVAASNQDLGALVREGRFRADLLMRLNPALALRLPPLVERLEDLPGLASLATTRFFADGALRREVAARVRAAGGRELPDGFAVELAPDEEAAERSEAPVVFVLPRKGWKALAAHPWPGNVRQLEMVLSDLLAATLYGTVGPRLGRPGQALLPVEAGLLFGLLAGAQGDAAVRERSLVLPRPRGESVEAWRRELERAAFRALFREAGGDFALMAERMTGERKDERAVRLRFNRLGLSARAER